MGLQIVCVCMYVCVYIYKYIYAYIYMFVCMFMCVCLYIYKIFSGKCFELSFLFRKIGIQHVVFINFTIQHWGSLGYSLYLHMQKCSWKMRYVYFSGETDFLLLFYLKMINFWLPSPFVSTPVQAGVWEHARGSQGREQAHLCAHIPILAKLTLM